MGGKVLIRNGTLSVIRSPRFIKNRCLENSFIERLS